MVNLFTLDTHTIELLASFILLGLTYCISVTFNGYLQAWLLAKMGDTTAKDAGYLQLNPLAHLDIIGFILFTIMAIGWYTPIPRSVRAFTGKLRMPKIALAFALSVLVMLALAIVYMVICLKLTSEPIILSLLNMLWSENFISFSRAIAQLAGYSKITVIGTLLFSCLVYLNMCMAVFALVYNSIYYLSFINVPMRTEYTEGQDMFLKISVFAVLYLFSHRIAEFFLAIIFKASSVIVHLLG